MEVGRKKHDELQPKPIRQQLWWIVISPLVWSVHFLACYITTAIWCEKYAATGDARTLLSWVSAYTAMALIAIIAVGLLSFKSFRRSDAPMPYEFDDPSDRTHFLGFTAFLLSLLSLIATLLTALVFVMVRSCD